MTPKAAIRQSDLQRIFRAAKAAGCTVTINLQTMQLTVHPQAELDGRASSVDQKLLGKAPAAEEPNSLQAWRQQNEERKKFAPRHQLRANQNRVLHILQSHPEGLPMNSIPGAAEKTMALLAKLDLVESSVDGTSGDRIWRLSLYGKDELEREKIYLSW